MGHTRLIITDATTAEATSVLKNKGFLENDRGGCFLSYHSPAKIYVVWGRSPYYPELLEKSDFPPRIQIHLKCGEKPEELTKLTRELVLEIRNLSPGTLFSVYNIDSGEGLNF
jgi:hypothetical protein